MALRLESRKKRRAGCHWESSHASFEALRLIAQEPIPEGRYACAHALSSRSEEVMIRRAAIWGLEDLARRGMLDAETELLGLVQAPDTAVRETAALAYLRTRIDRQQRLAELREAVAPEDHWILKLQDLADVRRMPQPNPRDEPATKSPGRSSAGTPDPARALKAHPAKEKTSPPGELSHARGWRPGVGSIHASQSHWRRVYRVIETGQSREKERSMFGTFGLAAAIAFAQAVHHRRPRSSCTSPMSCGPRVFM